MEEIGVGKLVPLPKEDVFMVVGKLDPCPNAEGLEGVEVEPKEKFLATFPEPGTRMELPGADSSVLVDALKAKVDLEGAGASDLVAPKEKGLTAAVFPNDEPPPKLDD